MSRLSTPDGAHFLSRGLAARLVAEAEVSPGELVFDLGAGHGVISAALAESGARVIAVERDPRLARRLERRFSDNSAVRVVHGDVRTIPLPGRDFRVVANVPFGVTTELLRRLLSARLWAADIVLADGVCRALTTPRPRNAATLRWATRYSFTRGRRLPARSFHPPPSVDAAALVIRRRRDPLLATTPERRAFSALLAAAYQKPARPWAASVAGLLTHRQAVRLAAANGLRLDLPAAELSVHDWVAAARVVSRGGDR